MFVRWLEGPLFGQDWMPVLSFEEALEAGSEEAGEFGLNTLLGKSCPRPLKWVFLSEGWTVFL